MTNLRYFIIATLVVLTFVFAGCGMFGNDGPENGTLTVSINNATAVNNFDFQVAVSTVNAEFSGEEDVIGLGKPKIENGSAEAIVKEYYEGSASDDTWTGAGGETYYVRIVIIDSSGDSFVWSHIYQPYPYEYSQDGDEVLETTLSEYKDLTE